MKLLVAGAARFIGSHAARAALERGLSVRVVAKICSVLGWAPGFDLRSLLADRIVWHTRRDVGLGGAAS